jgi:hypothetical protein
MTIISILPPPLYCWKVPSNVKRCVQVRMTAALEGSIHCVWRVASSSYPYMGIQRGGGPQ